MAMLLVYAMLTSAAYYLGSRAVITSWLWSRYPPKLARFMDCAACAGTWYGVILGLVGMRIPMGSLLSIRPGEWYSPIFVGLCSMVWTPIMSAVMQVALDRLGTAVPEDDASAK